VSPAAAARGRLAAAELAVLLARHGADSALDSAGRCAEATEIAKLVGLLPDALLFERGLREQWADEARRWLLRAASFPLAAASARVLAALRVPLDADAADALLAAACAAAAAAEGGTVARGLGGAFGGGFGGANGERGDARDVGRSSSRLGAGGGAVSARAASMAADLAGLLLDTLTEMFVLVQGERETVAFAHVFWGAAACLRTMHVPTYARAARLFAAVAAAWPLDDPSGAAVEILRAAAPAKVGTPLAALAPAAVFADSNLNKASTRKYRNAKTLAAAAAAAAHEAWLQGVTSPERFADVWRLPPPPATPPPAMRLADLAPLLLKGLARPSCAAHALRALAAIAPVVGVGDAWGGERALALVTAGLVPAALAAAAAAEAAPGTDLGLLRNARSSPDAVGVGEGIAAGRWCAAGLRAAAASARDKNPRAAALAAALEGALPGAGASFSAPRGRRTAPPPPARAEPLFFSESGNAPRGASSFPAETALVSGGASSRVARLADAIADPLFRFVAPRHIAAVAKALVDVAVAVARSARHGGAARDAENVDASVSSLSVSASLEVLIRLVARASSDAAAKAALLEASASFVADNTVSRPANAHDGGGRRSTASSAFAPVASLLEGPHSAPALELLRRVADLGEGVAANVGVETDDGFAKHEGFARLGAPSAMWNSVDANGGRAVDLMYGVAAAGRIDPNHAALPACLVGSSADARRR
jgi:hypothetical protein